jgi:hypothetical protein
MSTFNMFGFFDGFPAHVFHRPGEAGGVLYGLGLLAFATFAVDDLASVCCAHAGSEPKFTGTFTF